MDKKAIITKKSADESRQSPISCKRLDAFSLKDYYFYISSGGSA
jgi:hypothetical protein